LMILPYGNETVWYENSETNRISFLGQHGGLHEEEMLVPFAITTLSNLKEQQPAGKVKSKYKVKSADTVRPPMIR
jgi:hypothetical protein